MRAIIQRANGAEVRVGGELISHFGGEGLVVLVGVTHGDGEREAEYVARKIAELRVLHDEQSAVDLRAPVIVVSQFTLYADIKKGRRPSWNAAAPGDLAEPLVNRVIELLRERGLDVGTGVFGAHMRLSLTNDGPMTIVVDSALAQG
jgi:D-tyrosyl-tRNA(Tyr) deacylase